MKFPTPSCLPWLSAMGFSHWAMHSWVWTEPEHCGTSHSSMRERQLVSATTCASSHFCYNSGTEWLCFIVLIQLNAQNEMLVTSSVIIKLDRQFHWNFSTRSEKGPSKLSPSTLPITSVSFKICRIYLTRGFPIYILPGKYVSCIHRLTQIVRDTGLIFPKAGPARSGCPEPVQLSFESLQYLQRLRFYNLLFPYSSIWPPSHWKHFSSSITEMPSLQFLKIIPCTLEGVCLHLPCSLLFSCCWQQ